MKKLKLRKWVLVSAFLIIVSYLVISLFTNKTVVKEKGKDYTCYGSKLLQVCSGYDYDVK